ncbi:MAG: ParB/RepB/Spo0J family partition protein, partial [Rhodobacterales bacterium]|nr:ParB/RepB/Spo0J family partition protein [Rhodobacterales bacterium]
LSPVEEARGYARLLDEFRYTQDRLAEIVGKSRSHVANMLRLLTLPSSVLEMLGDGRLSAGHARALIGIPNAAALAAQVVARGLSVRDAEALARKARAPRPAARQATEKDPDTRALEADLAAALGLKVQIEHRAERGSGELRVRYRNLEDLDGL